MNLTPSPQDGTVKKPVTAVLTGPDCCRDKTLHGHQGCLWPSGTGPGGIRCLYDDCKTCGSPQGGVVNPDGSASGPDAASVGPAGPQDALAQALFEAEDPLDDDGERMAQRMLGVLRAHGWDVTPITAASDD